MVLAWWLVLLIGGAHCHGKESGWAHVLLIILCTMIARCLPTVELFWPILSLLNLSCIGSQKIVMDVISSPVAIVLITVGGGIWHRLL